MPLVVKDYTWNESKGEIILKLPLKGVKASKVDVVATDSYIKASYPPYMFECFLFGDVSEGESTCKIGDGLISFRLIKKFQEVWGRLEAGDPSQPDKEALKKKRDEALKKNEENLQKKEKERLERKREEERFAVREQIRLNQEDRDRIEGLKQEERDKATSEIEGWKTGVNKEMSSKVDKESPVKDVLRKSIPLWDDDSRELTPAPVRGSGKISVSFTPRLLPTAARESRLAEEEEWMSKMAEARRIKVVDKEDNIGERDPEALREKGNSFFRHGDWDSAISAYTQALVLNPNIPSLYSNRSACYLKKREFDQCIEDCHKALELFYPVVPSNHKQRVKVFARRGLAYAQQGFYRLALQDYDAALQLVPNDEQLKKDKTKIQELIGQS